MITYQEIIEGIETLPIEEQDNLFELIRKRRVEQRRSEIATDGERLRQSLKAGTAIKFDNVENLKSYLFDEDDECEPEAPFDIERSSGLHPSDSPTRKVRQDKTEA